MTMLFAGINTLIFAQGGGYGKRTPEEIAQMRTERMAENLGLNDEQKAAVLKVNLNAAQKMKGTNRMDRAAYETMQKENEEQFKKILTNDQFEKFKTMQQERRGRMNNRRGNGGNE